MASLRVFSATTPWSGVRKPLTMSLFKLRKSGSPRDLEVSMSGLKLGSKVLQIGGSDGRLIAALASAVGLSGYACAIATDDVQGERFTRAAAAAGVLVEVSVSPLGGLPYDPESFDVVVIKDVIGEMRSRDRVACLQQAYRALRVGGRCLVIEQAMRAGLGALFSQRAFDTQYVARGGAQTALKAEGFRGVRRLAERDGVSFTEGTK